MNNPASTIETLRIAILQPNIIPNDVETNLARYTQIIQNALSSNLPDPPPPPHLIILPEFFATGFITESSSHAVRMGEGPIFDWINSLSLQYNALIMGSVAIKENGHLYNRMILAQEGQIRAAYDKAHLFFYGGEGNIYTPGTKRIIYSYRGWRILPLICYDIRFPLWAYNASSNGQYLYDILVYAANFPTPRINVWDNLLQARAIENQCYVVGCNRIGVDHNELHHPGHSAIIDPQGRIITTHHNETESLISATAHAPFMKRFRAKYPFIHDGANDKRLTDDLP